MTDQPKSHANKPETHEDDTSLSVPEHVEVVEENGKPVRHRGIFLLPNLLTTAALFSAFYAILSAMNGKYEEAAIAIFVAMIFDGLDGRVARLTNTSSPFGVQYDSLSDMVSFGVAPAVVAFSWSLNSLGKVGWAIAFVYVSCAALRLARFNTQVGEVDSRFFIGLASPAAASLVAGFIWALNGVEQSTTLQVVSGVVTALAGLLMVLNVKYYSFKGVDFKSRVPFVMMLVAILVIVVISIEPPVILFILAAAYACSGPVALIVRKLKRN